MLYWMDMLLNYHFQRKKKQNKKIENKEEWIF